MLKCKQAMYFHQKYRIDTDWDENERLFPHKNSKVIVNAIRPPTALSKFE